MSLWLPAAEQPALGRLEKGLQLSRALALAGKPSILLVDDHEILRELLAEQLEELGYKVTQAASGEQAVALMDRGLLFDLMVTDLSMPGMDGVATIREAQRRRGRIPIVLLTGYAGDAAALVIGQEITGAFSLLRKPVEAQHLAERMAILLEGAQTSSFEID